MWPSRESGGLLPRTFENLNPLRAILVHFCITFNYTPKTNATKLGGILARGAPLNETLIVLQAFKSSN